MLEINIVFKIFFVYRLGYEMLKNKFSYYLIVILIFLVAFQFSAWGIADGVYSIIRYMIIIAVTILFVLNVKNIKNCVSHESIFVVHFIALLFSGFLMLLITIFGYDVELSPIRDFLLAFVFILIGYNLKLNIKNIEWIYLLFSVLFTFSSLSIIYKFSNGFSINEQYLPVPKNQLSPVYGMAFILSLYCGTKSMLFRKVLFFTCAFILFNVLLVMRGRGTLVAVFIVAIVFLFFFLKSKKSKLIAIAAGLLSVPFFIPKIYNSFFLNYDASSLESVSAGRFDNYIVGLLFIKENFFDGALGESFIISGTIHNYLIYNFVNYGFVLFSPMLLLYFLYVFKIVKAIKCNSFNVFEVAPLMMLVIFIVSLFEYTYPYAPGSAVLFPILFFGVYLKQRKVLI